MTVENYNSYLRQIRGLGAGMTGGAFSLGNAIIEELLSNKRTEIHKDLESGKLTTDEVEKLYGAIEEATDPQ